MWNCKCNSIDEIDVKFPLVVKHIYISNEVHVYKLMANGYTLLAMSGLCLQTTGSDLCNYKQQEVIAVITNNRK